MAPTQQTTAILSPARRLLPGLMLAVAFLLADGNRSQAADAWADHRVAKPFVCWSDAPLDGLEGLLGELAQLQNDLIRHLEISPASERIEIYLFRNHSTYRRYLREQLPGLPYRRALYFKRDGPGMVLAYRSKDLAKDLRHECTHALLHATLPMAPLWLDEGLAEYFELPRNERAYDNPYLSKTRWEARLGMASDLESLEKLATVGDMGAGQYRRSWAWVHFMLHGSTEARQELLEFLDDIEAHTPPGQLSSRLQQRLPDLKSRYAAHFRGWKR